MTIPEDENKLDTCGCCEGTTPQERHYNRPGQPVISYRLGTHSTFLSRMKERLSKKRIPDGKHKDSKPLKKLTTRSTDDPSIAILDAWALVTDVLTFYQERIANEGFLRTATERRSVLEMARAIGYELKPGVAAGTYLTFTLEDAEGAPGAATIDEGTRVLSIPGQNEKPQVFETIETIEGRAEWNSLKPRMTEPPKPGLGAKEVYLSGVDTGLKPGDGLLFVGDEREFDLSSERWDFRKVQTVTTNPVAGYTKVTWDEGLRWECINRVYSFGQQAALFGYNAPDFRVMANCVKEAYSTTNNEWPDYSIASLGKRKGLYAEYYNGIEFNDLKERRIDSEIDFVWSSGLPYPDINASNFSVRWTGFIVPDIRGDYNFEIESQGGVRLWIEGNRVIDSPYDSLKNDKITYELEKDHIYDITLEYFYFQTWIDIINGKNAEPIVKLYWKKPDGWEYLFSWNNIPGNDNERLIGFLRKRFDIEWVNQAEIEKNDSEKTITLSFENNYIYLNLNEDKTKVILTIDDVRTDEFIAKTENDKLYIYHQDKVIIPKNELHPSDIFLDAIYKEILPDSWLVLTIPEYMEIYQAGTVVEDSQSNFTISAKTTRVTLKGENLDLFNKKLRETVVFAQSQLLEMAEVPLSTHVSGDSITLDCKIDNLSEGQLMVISGKDVINGEDVSEVVALSRTEDIGYLTRIVFSPVLTHTYYRDTVTINANVARATHGETVSEVLGSGNAGESYQMFLLKKAPLTYVSAPTPSGTSSTLKIHVDGVLWKEAPSFFNLDRDNRSYIVRIDDDSKTHITFGDGKKGARLPTGIENITTTYRNGIGPEGEVSAGSLTLLQSRPPGVRSVTNPLAASGAQSPEQLSDARRNAPMTVQTLDRIVSLQDFENLARSFAGIGKAQAQALHVGQSRLVHITVASASGSEIGKTSKTYKDLCSAIDSFRDPIESVQVDGFQLRTFSIDALLIIDKRYFADDVKSQVEASLTDAFSFDNRDFGQPVSAAEVFSVMQSVEGVIAIDLNKLELDNVESGSVLSTTILSSNKARVEDNTPPPLKAELLLLDPEGLKLRCIQHE